ncbi:hypothetical protein J4460_00565 [Candidatus Woesearchaeota archaeon]|nr:MAG: hypothetical protein QS99_C0002G0074 [archaeon GW2011_AR4]MBS3129143.1 hypothetical protein [Candidatus Woesearchaeota archaeon]HIH37876.1 hypothetical protein [Candidatus Woesearchaeota archaeon]HIH48849.1 hypothetical protein [Candidatus Woesearchaeota archaeon]HIJ04003.1 hypothetical protein [Candidatus Woesearchaeota archaeon]
MASQQQLDTAIISLMKESGPLIPVKVAKTLNTSILIASAMLSTLTSNGKVKTTFLKIDGTPLYYLPGQESDLAHYADNLNEKDKKTFERLSHEHVLRDGGLTPLERVSIRTLKDFAVPIEVTIHGEKELFWRWYLSTNEEIKPLIGRLMGIPEKPVPVSVPTPEPKEASLSPPPKEEPLDEKIEEREELVEEQEEKDEQEDESSKSLEQPISKKAFPTPKSPFKHATIKKDDKGSFFDDLHLFFDESDIAIQSETILKKNAEAEYILHVPSPIGSILFYCRAKGKKTLTEGDISTVFLAGQSKKLPILLLTNGSVSKKALAMLSNECQGMLVKNIYDGNTTN